MKKMLIVEDEKLIRKGIRAIAERSGVFIEEIIEARNGAEAYEYLKIHKVDLIFTDIRMPKMNGVLLVQKLKEDHNLPKVIVISGFDDFQYATELMRCGARDYILKPVEMDHVISILQKMDEEIKAEQELVKEQEKLREFQLKKLIFQKDTNLILAIQFTEFFKQKSVVIICSPVKLGEIPLDYYWKIVDENQFIYVMLEEIVEEYIGTELKKIVGISGGFYNLENISINYEEAMEKRKQCFLEKRVEIAEEKGALLAERQIVNYIQMIGTVQVVCCIDFLKKLLWDAQRGIYKANDYIHIMERITEQVQESYADVLSSEEKQTLMHTLLYPTAKEYLCSLEKYIMKINAKIVTNYEEYKNQIKMKEAMQYIQENYEKDLNMAEVANYIGISYSWFSTVFKQYAEMNFVNYLKNIRLEKAQKLLSGTDLRIQEISRKVGYENEVHFMKMFKSTYGISPTKYRNVCNVVKECVKDSST